MNQLQELIHATGFDTFEQAMAFIHEARDIFTAAEKSCVPPKNEEERQKDEASGVAIMKALGDDMTRRALAKLEEAESRATASAERGRAAEMDGERLKDALVDVVHRVAKGESMAEIQAFVQSVIQPKAMEPPPPDFGHPSQGKTKDGFWMS